MDLQTAFYIISIVYMGVVLLLIIAILAAVFVIKAKVNHVYKMIDEKVVALRRISVGTATIWRTAKYFIKDRG